jgi:hypothetical protein
MVKPSAPSVAFSYKDEGAILHLTKMDAARRQLRTAIELWFLDGDPVSIHALAFSAYEIIHNIYRAKGLSDLLFDGSFIQDEYRGEFAKLLKADASFFKHALKDTTATRKFNPISNYLFLCMSVLGLTRMGETLNDTEGAFNFWLFVHRRRWFIKKIPGDEIPVEAFDQIRRFNKQEFLELYKCASDDNRPRQVDAFGRIVILSINNFQF